MNEKQKNFMYGVIGVLVLMALLPFGSLSWDAVSRPMPLLVFSVVVGWVLWHLAKKRKP